MKRSKKSKSKIKDDIATSSNTDETSNSECDDKHMDFIEKPIPVGQSTPNRNDLSVHSEMPGFDYLSTLCSQTQEGGVEVVWDWPSPSRKIFSNYGKNMRSPEAYKCGTPKRTPLAHKKRISNSPLIYKPLKRVLITKENTEDIDRFKAELIALSEKIKEEQKESKLETNETESINKVDITGEIEFGDLNNDENNDLVSTSNEKLLIQNDNKGNKNFDDLFNDSLNETMIKCSQEIEERLNIAPANTKEKNNISESGKSKNFLADYNSMKLNLEFEKTKLINDQSPTILRHKSTSSIVSTKTTVIPPKDTEVNSNFHGIDDLCIPDDSFDEFIATCDEDFSESDANLKSSKNSRYGKVYDSSLTVSPKKSGGFLPKIPDKPSSSTTRNWKFFKSKSHSDSSFASNNTKSISLNFKPTNQMGLQSIYKASPNTSISSKGGRRSNSNSVVSTSHQIEPIHRTSSYQDSNVMTKKCVQKNNTHNFPINHVNRYPGKEDGSVSDKNTPRNNTRDVTSDFQAMHLCGPEEIERKRMQAKIKLQAKRRRERMRSCLPSVLPKSQHKQ